MPKPRAQSQKKAEAELPYPTAAGPMGNRTMTSRTSSRRMRPRSPEGDPGRRNVPKWFPNCRSLGLNPRRRRRHLTHNWPSRTAIGPVGNRTTTPTEDRKKQPEITLEQLNQVLRKLSPNKALGPDRWHPKEIPALPDSIKQGLIQILHKAEETGRWPEGN